MMLQLRSALRLVGLPLALMLPGCSGSSSGPSPLLAPVVLSATQDRDIDVNGTTVVLRFNTTLLATTALDPKHYVASEGQVALGVFLHTPRSVRVQFDAPVIPGQTTLDVEGVHNYLLQRMTPVKGLAIRSNDKTPPRVKWSMARAVPNAHNDEVTVQFDDLMIEDDILDPANFAFEHNGPVDLTSAVFSYFHATRKLVIRLENQLPAVNLQTGDAWKLTIQNARDLGGNAIAASTVETGVVSEENVPPHIVGVMQNTLVDPLGTTVDVMFDEVVSATAAQAGTYAASRAQQVVSASVVGDGDIVRILFTKAVVPTSDTLDVASVADLAGNVMAPVTAHLVVPAENPPVPPGIASIHAETVSGPFNDFIEVTYTEPVLPVGATLPCNYQVHAASLAEFSVLDPETVITYDPTTRTAIITLSSQACPINLKTFEDYTVVVDNVRDVAGNLIEPATTMTATVQAGDNVPPTVQQISQNAAVDPLGETVDVTFDEVVDAGCLEWATFVVSGGTATRPNAFPVSASLVGSGDMVRVKFDGPVVPKTHRLDVIGIEDLAGNVMVELMKASVTASELTPPKIDYVMLEAVTGQFNDRMIVIFDEPVLRGGAEMLGNFTLSGYGLAPDNEIRYDQATRTTTITLTSRTTPINLQYGDRLSGTVSGVADVSGNVMTMEAFSDVTVGGDNVPPEVVASLCTTFENSGNDRITVLFDEEVVENTANDPANYRLTSPFPGGPTIDLAGARANYLFNGRVSKVLFVLPMGVNLRTTPDTYYELVVSGVKDHAGNTVAPNACTGQVLGDFVRPRLLQATQRTTIDPSGTTIDMVFDEEMDELSLPAAAVSAELVPGQIGPPAPNLTGLSLIGSNTAAGAIVRATFDDAVMPGIHQLDVFDLRDLAGNPMASEPDFAVKPEDFTLPTLSATGTDFIAFRGRFNDLIRVQFSERVVPSDAMDIDNYTLIDVAAPNIPFYLDGVVFYDVGSRIARIRLTGQYAPIDLQYGTEYQIAVSNVRDLAGNVMAPGTAVNKKTIGDNTPPSIEQATQKTTVNPAGNTVWLTFSEALAQTYAETRSNYALGSSGGDQPMSARVLLGTAGVPTDVVELTFTGPVGINDSIWARFQDVAGNRVERTMAVVSEDTVAPAVEPGGIAAVTVPNRQNDYVTVKFTEPVLSGEAGSAGHFELYCPATAPLPLDLSDATCAYDSATRTTTIVLGSAVHRHDLKTNDSFQVKVSDVHDLAGNVIADSTTAGIVTGDLAPPAATAAKWKNPFRVDVTFDEELDPVWVEAQHWTAPTFFDVIDASLMADGMTVRLYVFPIAPPGAELGYWTVDLAGNEARGSVNVTF